MARKKRILTTLLLSFIVIFFMGKAAVGAAYEKVQRNKPVAEEMKGLYGINWVPNVEYSSLVLTISKPGGEVIGKTFDAGSVPGFSFSGSFWGKFPDGSYTYELRVASTDMKLSGHPLTQTGYFKVREGRIIGTNESGETPDRALCTCQDINEDLVVEGSLCAGHDCQYTGDCHVETLRLKEENVRIYFDDTSSSSYPDNDWMIIVNDDNSGSGEYFSIHDETADTRPFTIEAGAPDNSVYVDSDGKIGFGTSTPNYELEIYGKTDAKCAVVLHEPEGATSYLNAIDYYGNVGTTTNHPFRIVTNELWRMRINTDDTLDMSDGGSYDGTWNDASSRQYKENIQVLTVDEALDTLEGLNPVKFNYKKHQEEERLGFIAEDVPELVAFKDRNVMSAMDIVAVLTKVVQKQQETSKEQQETISQLKKEIENLKKKLK